MRIFSILFALFLATNTYASKKEKKSNDSQSYDSQSSDSGSKDSGSKDSGSHDNGDSVPLDGGLSILLLGAAAFGAKKLHDTRK